MIPAIPKEKNRWITIALVNLTIVAFLGTILRSKILFSIPWIDFKFLLHAHSHFAFAGWITLCLFTLMTFEILPAGLSGKPIYKILLIVALFAAAGMLFSFPFQGYAFFSILFSTLFIVVTYVFSWVFIKDLLKSRAEKAVRILCIVGLIAADLSSVGPFTLAYMMARHFVDTPLNHDAIFTYLHLQYNGFFTLCVFALFFNQFYQRFTVLAKHYANRFSIVLAASVLPTLFLSYLWHYPNIVVRSIAILGCVLLVSTLVLFVAMVRSMKSRFRPVDSFASLIGSMAMLAFFIKTALQTGIVIPSIGNQVLFDRPVIIGYIHLVMLGFVTLYLFAHLVYIGYFQKNIRLSKTGIVIFAIAVIANEIILMTQGAAVMSMVNSALYPWLLWIVAICLLTGSFLISLAAVKRAAYRPFYEVETPTMKKQLVQPYKFQ